MEKLPQNIENNHNKKYQTIFSVVVVLFVIIVMFFLYSDTYNITLLEKTSDKKVFSEGEKLEILKNLSSESEDILSVEEKRAILNNISDNKPSDAHEYSEEGKLQILRSLQE